MSRSIVSLGVLGHMPLDDLPLADHFRLELASFMTELRQVVNAARKAPEWNRQFHQDTVRYALGRLHGCLFSFRSAMIHLGGYDETLDWSDGVSNEADFLAYDYLLPESMRYTPAKEREEMAS